MWILNPPRKSRLLLPLFRAELGQLLWPCFIETWSTRPNAKLDKLLVDNFQNISTLSLVLLKQLDIYGTTKLPANRRRLREIKKGAGSIGKSKTAGSYRTNSGSGGPRRSFGKRRLRPSQRGASDNRSADYPTGRNGKVRATNKQRTQ